MTKRRARNGPTEMTNTYNNDKKNQHRCAESTGTVPFPVEGGNVVRCYMPQGE